MVGVKVVMKNAQLYLNNITHELSSNYFLEVFCSMVVPPISHCITLLDERACMSNQHTPFCLFQESEHFAVHTGSSSLNCHGL
jgi:hypothetical protein